MRDRSSTAATGEGGGQILRTAARALARRPARRSGSRRSAPAGRSPGLHAPAPDRGPGRRGGRQGRGRRARRSARASSRSRRARSAPATTASRSGTAGSTTLVLQTVLPGAARAPTARSTVAARGRHAQPDGAAVRLPREGASCRSSGGWGRASSATLERPGFYPAGGGGFRVDDRAGAARSRRLELLERGEIRAGAARGGRRAAPARDRRARAGDRLGAASAGSRRASRSSRCRFRRAGERRPRRARERARDGGLHRLRREGRAAPRAVAEAPAREVRRYLAAGVPVGEHLADQLLLPMALAGAGTFRTTAPSKHTTRRSRSSGSSSGRWSRAPRSQGGATWRFEASRKG